MYEAYLGLVFGYFSRVGITVQMFLYGIRHHSVQRC